MGVISSVPAENATDFIIASTAPWEVSVGALLKSVFLEPSVVEQKPVNFDLLVLNTRLV